jgi:hypothetical protein
MTQTNSTTPSIPPPHVDPAADSESLLHLHKMSTTAGLGSQDYVAVNVLSVIAVLFGLASLLAIASPVLLVFPIVGVALSLIALRQVRHSNGTQTGAGLAILGLVLSGVITASIFVYQGFEAVHRRADQATIANLIRQYGGLLSQHQYAPAYDLFDSDFQNRVSKREFVEHLGTLFEQKMEPPIESVDWNGLAAFHVDDEDIETADSVMKMNFKGSGGPVREEIHFKRASGGPWLIDNIPDQFPPKRTH